MVGAFLVLLSLLFVSFLKLENEQQAEAADSLAIKTCNYKLSVIMTWDRKHFYSTCIF